MVTLLPLLEVWHHQPICNVVSALPHLHPIQSLFFPSLLSLKAFSIELFVVSAPDTATLWLVEIGWEVKVRICGVLPILEAVDSATF